MSAVLAAGLAAAAAAVVVAVPRPGGLRLHALTRAPRAARRPVSSWLWLAVPAGLLLGPVPGLLALAGTLLLRRWSRSRAAAARAVDERAGVLEACGVLAAELRAGRDPATALSAAAEVAAGPAREALRAAAAAAGIGGDVAVALTSPAGSAVPEVLRALAACWTVCAGSGSGLASAVERLAEGLRAAQAQRRAVDAELAGPRATAGLLAVLPAFGLLMAAGLGADPVHVLLRTPLGLACLVLGLGLDAVGLWWTGRLVRRAGGTA